MSEQTQQLHAIVHGRVQGVSFRYYTQQEASRLALTGWVRNRPDGTVELVAEGPRSALDTLLAWLHHGPPTGQVTQVEAAWGTSSGAYSRFDITR